MTKKHIPNSSQLPLFGGDEIPVEVAPQRRPSGVRAAVTPPAQPPEAPSRGETEWQTAKRHIKRRRPYSF